MSTQDRSSKKAAEECEDTYSSEESHQTNNQALTQEVIDQLLVNSVDSVLNSSVVSTSRASLSNRLKKTWKRTSSGRWSLGRKPTKGDAAFESQNPMFDPFNKEEVCPKLPQSYEINDKETAKIENKMVEPSDSELESSTIALSKEVDIDQIPKMEEIKCPGGHRMEFFESDKAQVWCCICSVNLMSPNRRIEDGEDDDDDDSEIEDKVEVCFGCQKCCFRVCLKSCYSTYFHSKQWFNILKTTPHTHWRRVFEMQESTRFPALVFLTHEAERSADIVASSSEQASGGHRGDHDVAPPGMVSIDHFMDLDDVSSIGGLSERSDLSVSSLGSSSTAIVVDNEVQGSPHAPETGRLELVLAMLLFHGMVYDMDMFSWLIGTLKSGKDLTCDTRWVLSLLFSSFCGVAKFLPSRVQTVVLDMFRTDPRIDPTFCRSRCIWLAARNNDTGLVKFLLEDGRADPGAHRNYAAGKAAEFGNLDMFNTLLKHPQVNVADCDNYCIRFATEGMHHEIMRSLLADPRVDPTAGSCYALWTASTNKDEVAVRLLLDHPAVSPADDAGSAVFAACFSGSIGIMELFLQDEQVDTEDLMFEAVRGGSLEMVRFLENHHRINFDDYEMLVDTACEYGHLNIFQYLHPKVAHIIGVDKAIRLGHVEIVEYALKNELYRFIDAESVSTLIADGDFDDASRKLQMVDLLLEYISDEWFMHAKFEKFAATHDMKLFRRIFADERFVGYPDMARLVGSAIVTRRAVLEKVQMLMPKGCQVDYRLLCDMAACASLEVAQHCMEYPGFVGDILGMEWDARKASNVLRSAVANSDQKVLPYLLSIDAPAWTRPGPPLPSAVRGTSIRSTIQRSSHNVREFIRRTPPMRLHLESAIANRVMSEAPKLFTFPFLNPLADSIHRDDVINLVCRNKNMSSLVLLLHNRAFQVLNVSVFEECGGHGNFVAYKLLLELSMRALRLKESQNCVPKRTTIFTKASAMLRNKPTTQSMDPDCSTLGSQEGESSYLVANTQGVGEERIIADISGGECYTYQAKKQTTFGRSGKKYAIEGVEADWDSILPHFHLDVSQNNFSCLGFAPLVSRTLLQKLLRHPTIAQEIRSRVAKKQQKLTWVGKAVNAVTENLVHQVTGQQMDYFDYLLERAVFTFRWKAVQMILDSGSLAFNCNRAFNSLIRGVALRGIEGILRRLTGTIMSSPDRALIDNRHALWQTGSSWWLPYESEEVLPLNDTVNPLWNTEARLVGAFKKYPGLYTHPSASTRGVEGPIDEISLISELSQVNDVRDWEECCRILANCPEVRYAPFGPQLLRLAYHVEYPAVLRALAPLELDNTILGGLCVRQQCEKYGVNLVEVIWDILELFCPLFLKPTEEETKELQDALDLADTEREARGLELENDDDILSFFGDDEGY